MPDFNQENPPVNVTNPVDETPKGAEYPKTLYKAGEGKKSAVVAWDEDKPIHNQLVTVDSAEAAEKYLADGYATKPVLKAKK